MTAQPEEDMDETQRVVCLDLDETQLDTISELFWPVIIRAAEVSDKSVAEAHDSINRVGDITFTFESWLADLGIPERDRTWFKAELEADLATRAPDCLYPGMRTLLGKLKESDRRLVLITAGDPGYQKWKFGLLKLEDIFKEEDRHFVPLKGSKADVIARYMGPEVEIDWVDDSPRWQLEVVKRYLPVRGIRPRWPKSTNQAKHTHDGVLWETTDTIEELEQLLFAPPTSR